MLQDYKYTNKFQGKQHRINNGENPEKVSIDIENRWKLGNEKLWDNYNIESLIDTDEKYNNNYVLYKRIKTHRYNLEMIKMITDHHFC